ncbi:MAG: hypothetical protein AAFY15_00295 [Cyanobacteria bacterium J06648_11]
MTTAAPIAVFAFNRPDHLEATLAALLRCRGADESPIHVFADGPRHSGEADAVDATRRVAVDMLGDRAEFRFAEGNQGLAASISAGVGELVERFGRVIVVEDDLELSQEFLSYMNAALNRFEASPEILQVSGFSYEVASFSDRDEGLVFPLTTTWGWATWERAWRRYDPEATDWEKLISDKTLARRFNLDGAYDYTTMLKRQMRGQLDSWGIRWYWSVFRAGGLVVYPPQTLVVNRGMDGSGTHGKGLLTRFGQRESVMRDTPVDLPEEPIVDAQAWAMLKRSIWVQNGGYAGQIRNWIRSKIGR